MFTPETLAEQTFDLPESIYRPPYADFESSVFGPHGPFDTGRDWLVYLHSARLRGATQARYVDVHTRVLEKIEALSPDTPIYSWRFRPDRHSVYGYSTEQELLIAFPRWYMCSYDDFDD